MDDYLGIVAVCGEEGTGKTTMGLTFPKPIRHFDVDVGGYRRAIWRLSAEGTESKGYPKPIQLDKLKGSVTTPASTRALIPKKVEGMKELWQMIVDDFVAACQDTEVKTIIIDSATLLWNICHSSHLQMLQERQLFRWNNDPQTKNRQFDENDYRERLQPMEYGPANDRMRTILHTARSFSKNLVLVHYPTDEYGTIPSGKSDGSMVEGKTGNIILDGFKETKKLVDLVVWTSIHETTNAGVTTKLPVCKITKCGLEGAGLAAVGLEIPATYEGIINLVNLLKGAANATPIL
ncbi:MAG: AAA family ATPase [Candidatus Eisenbacteria sp.]|nr:AAA family ATPase [Candidatus Eisenbacteria bacterium]